MRRGILSYLHLSPGMLTAIIALWLLSLIVPEGQATPLWQTGENQAVTKQPITPAFVELSKALTPAVVNIVTKQGVQSRAEGDQFQEFFERFFGPQGPQRRQRRRPGQGSGFIINREGYIVTNFHVVENASDIQVTLTTHKQYNAKLIGGRRKNRFSPTEN